MPTSQPTLETPRLILRPCTLEDAPTIARLAGRREIADTTISVPHPYSEEMARQFVLQSAETWSEGRGVVFAITTRQGGHLVGMVGLRDLDRNHSHAEMGCWIGVEWWKQGYATEATRALLQFGFDSMGLNRIYAHHMLRNPASGRALGKAGLRKEGVLREAVRKWGKFEDVALWAAIKTDWQDPAKS